MAKSCSAQILLMHRLVPPHVDPKGYRCPSVSPEQALSLRMPAFPIAKVCLSGLVLKVQVLDLPFHRVFSYEAPPAVFFGPCVVCVS